MLHKFKEVVYVIVILLKMEHIVYVLNHFNLQLVNLHVYVHMDMLIKINVLAVHSLVQLVLRVGLTVIVIKQDSIFLLLVGQFLWLLLLYLLYTRSRIKRKLLENCLKMTTTFDDLFNHIRFIINYYNIKVYYIHILFIKW